MSTETKAKIRDRRKTGWFRVDDEVIEVYGPEIGAYGIAVYAALCKHVNREEEAYPGLRLLCKNLKMGRATLLKTLSQLEKVGLIEIEHGDRTSVNIYTLLDVPKRPQQGGSIQNQGGSIQNQGGSDQTQRGGSDQNRNQTKYLEPERRAREEGSSSDPPETYQPSKEHDDVAKNLVEIKGWEKDYNKTIGLIVDASSTYPDVDLEVVAKNLAFKIRTGAYSCKRPAQAFVNWVARESQDGNGYNNSNGKVPFCKVPFQDATGPMGRLDMNEILDEKLANAPEDPVQARLRERRAAMRRGL